MPEDWVLKFNVVENRHEFGPADVLFPAYNAATGRYEMRHGIDKGFFPVRNFTVDPSDPRAYQLGDSSYEHAYNPSTGRVEIVPKEDD